MITIKETIERYFQIADKKGRIHPLKLNEAQQKVYEIFREAYNSDKPVRLIILKARQEGISTLIEAIMTELAITHHNRNALIVAHDSDSTSKIYKMTKLYYDKLPPEIQPMHKYNNTRELTFDNPSDDPEEKANNPGLNSSIRVSTAGSSGIGRGSTLQYCHLSELAFWDDRALSELTGIFQTVPSDPRTMIAIESTANGYNHFKQLWDDAVEGRSDYTPIFLPWFLMQEYRMPYDGTPLTEEEIALKKTFSLDNDQIAWRRYKIRNDCHNDINAFRQEYPSTPEEAFILSGSPIFNVEEILKASLHAFVVKRKGIFRYTEKTSGEDAGRPQGLYFAEDPNGPVSIYQDPKKGHSYCIGSDTAGDGSDYFVSYVIDCNTGSIAAKYRCQTDEPLFVRQEYCLGKFYHNALLAIETNFSSYPTLKLQEYGYLNMYVREVQDTYQEKYTKRFGFKTTAITRPLIISNLQDLARDSIESIKDKDLLQEMLSFVKENGKPQAAPGMHDDCVMAAAIGYWCKSQVVIQTAKKTEENQDDKPADDIDRKSVV